MEKCNIKCPLCGEEMIVVHKISEKWSKIFCPTQTCSLSCFVKDISKLITKKDRFSQTDEALLLRRLEIKKLRSEKKMLRKALNTLSTVVWISNIEQNDVLTKAMDIAGKALEETK